MFPYSIYWALLNLPSNLAALLTGVYIGVASAVLVVLLVLTAAILCWVQCHRRRKRGRLDASGLNSLGLLHAPLGTEEIGRIFDKERKLVKEDSALCFSDPLEFPRDRLFMTDMELGKHGLPAAL